MQRRNITATVDHYKIRKEQEGIDPEPLDKIEWEIYRFLMTELRILNALNKRLHMQGELLTLCFGAKRKFVLGNYLWVIKYLQEVQARNNRTISELTGEPYPVEPSAEHPEYVRDFEKENARIDEWLRWLNKHQSSTK